MRFAGEMTDPIHRYIRFSEVERDIVDTMVFQRLRRIRQLAGAHLVYPSAQHSRFEHSIGTMHVAGYAGETLFAKGYYDDEDQVQQLRLAALLHDIGHGPFSHLFEEVLMARHNVNHEDMGKLIISQSEISDILGKYGYNPSDICKLSFGQSNIKFFNEIIVGGLSADMMDYLPRDGLFTGVEYGKIDYHRLISSFEVTTDGDLAISRSALYSLESMLISRYEMYKAVYFHKTVNNYLSLTDEITLEHICLLGNRNKSAVRLAQEYKSRKLLKCVYEKFFHSHDKLNRRLHAKALYGLESRISEIAQLKEEDTVFVDASSASSMPRTPTKEEISSILLIEKEHEYETPVSEIPLIASIAGSLDMLRVYTTAENRGTVEECTKKVLGSEESLYWRELYGMR